LDASCLSSSNGEPQYTPEVTRILAHACTPENLSSRQRANVMLCTVKTLEHLDTDSHLVPFCTIVKSSRFQLHDNLSGSVHLREQCVWLDHLTFHHASAHWKDTWRIRAVVFAVSLLAAQQAECEHLRTRREGRGRLEGAWLFDCAVSCTECCVHWDVWCGGVLAVLLFSSGAATRSTTQRLRTGLRRQVALVDGMLQSGLCWRENFCRSHPRTAELHCLSFLNVCAGCCWHHCALHPSSIGVRSISCASKHHTLALSQRTLAISQCQPALGSCAVP
jgi:hypothetical protein